MTTKAKNLIFILLAAVLIASCIAVFIPMGTAFAVEGEGDNGWQVVHDAKHKEIFGESATHGSATAIGADYFSSLDSYTFESQIEQSYYLTADITLTASLRIKSDVLLCLNGHKLQFDSSQSSVIYINDGGRLTLCDCNGSHGAFSYDEREGKYVFLSSDRETKVNGGVIAGGARGVYIDNGTFNFYGGTLAGNTVGFMAVSSGEVDMYGGEICGNGDYGIELGRGVKTVNMRGGKIYKNGNVNYTEAYGVDVKFGTFTMYGGEISEQEVGVSAKLGALGENTKFVMNGGKICKNVSGVSVDTALEITGGVICENELGVRLSERGAFNMSGGEISENSELGVRVDGNLTMTGGLITQNPEGVRVENGSVTVSGTPKIVGNVEASGLKRNLILNNVGVVTVEGVLESGTKIGVSADYSTGAEVGTFITAGYTQSGNTANPSTRFFTDGYYAIMLGANGEVYIGERNITSLWYTGKGVPEMFAKGDDLYLDTESADVYKYDDSIEDWIKIANLHGLDGINGIDGKSPYDIAVENGFEGTVEEWLESLKGANGMHGANGLDGKDADTTLVIAALSVACVAVVVAVALGVYIIVSKSRKKESGEQ